MDSTMRISLNADPLDFDAWWELFVYANCVTNDSYRDASAAFNFAMSQRYPPHGYTLVPDETLATIEDAIAFELGGEPCGLENAHALVKSLLDKPSED